MRFFSFLFILLVNCTALTAFDYCNCLEWCEWVDGGDVELRIGAFRPRSKVFRKIYAEWAPEYQIEASKNITCDWSLWANLTWYSKKGESLGVDYKTLIRLIPFSVGIKYLYHLSECFDLYAGIGICNTTMRIKDESPFVITHTVKNSLGGIIKTGVHYQLTRSFFLDIFVDYRLQPFRFTDSSRVERHDVNVGGWSIGAGLGYKL